MEKTKIPRNIRLIFLTLHPFRWDLHLQVTTALTALYCCMTYVICLSPTAIWFCSPNCHVFLCASSYMNNTSPASYPILHYFHLNNDQFLELHFHLFIFLLFMPLLEQKLSDGWDFVSFTRIFEAHKIMCGIG